MVMIVGASRGWLFPLGADTRLPVLFLVLTGAIAGTLVVIPTAAEIPLLQGLALAGVTAGPLGALLVTLPAVSLPGIAMVGRSLGWRASAAVTGCVVFGGLAGAALLGAL